MARGRKPLSIKDWGTETTAELRRLAKSRTERKDRIERAALVVYMLDNEGLTLRKAAPLLNVSEGRLQKWIRRYNAKGLEGLTDLAGRGRKALYNDEDVAFVLKTAHTKPTEIGLPFETWTVDDLTQYLREHLPQTISRTSIWTILHRNGFRWKDR